MNDQRNLIVGFDFSKDYTQFCCLNLETMEPESVSILKNKYLIPSVLGVKSYSKNWIFGEEAISCHEKNTAVLIDDLIGKMENKVQTEVFGTVFQPEILLSKFFRKCLQTLKGYFPNNSILKIVITVKNLNDNLVNGIYTALKEIGIDRDRAFVHSHAESYQYYALSQSKELWASDVGLFDFDEEGLTYHQISINRFDHPYVVSLSEKDYSQTLQYEMLKQSTEPEKLEYTFQTVAADALHRQVISTIYATGIGFDGEWSDNALKQLCIGRRVFKGQNLYSKGACYAAKEMVGEQTLSDFIFLGKDKIMGTIYTQGYLNSDYQEIVLAKALTPWYEVDLHTDFILDGTEEVPIIVKNIKTKKITTYCMLLHDIPKRPSRTTRIEIRVKFYNQTTAVITVKDKGFGDFYPSSNRIWEETIEIN